MASHRSQVRRRERGRGRQALDPQEGPIEAVRRGRARPFKRGGGDGTDHAAALTGKTIEGGLTLDIAYDDGERETRVAKRLIRKKGGSRSPSPKRGRNKLREGAKVSARYRGRSKYYPGRIERDRGDGTYDIYCRRSVYPLDAPRL